MADVQELELESVEIDKLKFAAYNPRSISQMDLQKLAASIEKFGFVDPIIVNRRSVELGYDENDLGNTIVGGHQRVRAAILLGWTHVPAVFVELSPGSEKALNVALNKIQGDWDGMMLAELLQDLKDDDTIDVLLTGFDPSEIDRLISAANIEVPDEFPTVGGIGGSSESEVSSDFRCPSCQYEWNGDPKPEGVAATDGA